MQINANVTVPRPTGKWEILKWNLLKGETEADAEVIKQDNLITDECIKRAVFSKVGISGNYTIFGMSPSSGACKFSLSSDTTEPYASVASSYATGNFASLEINLGYGDGGTSSNTLYFFPSGATGADVGKTVNSLRAYLKLTSSPDTYMLSAWLKLATGITIAAGDVIKVNATFNQPAATVTTTGSASLTTFAYGKDPAVPGDGVAAGSFDWTVNLSRGGNVFLFNLPIDAGRTVVTNGDGSLSFVETYTYTSAVKPVNGSAGDVPPINLTKSGVSLGTLSFTGATKPQWTPGSYYTITVAVTMTVAAA